jgi:hypothetical protein
MTAERDSSGYPCHAVAGASRERAPRENAGRCDAGSRRVSLTAMLGRARTYPPSLKWRRTIGAGDAHGVTTALARALPNRFSITAQRAHHRRFGGSARGLGFLFSFCEVHYERHDWRVYTLCAYEDRPALRLSFRFQPFCTPHLPICLHPAEALT